MKIYISGPITGKDPEEARRAFETAETEIRAKGHEPVNPYKLQCILAPETTTWEQYMRVALALLRECEAICMLPGWGNSQGARIENGQSYMDGRIIFDSVKEIRQEKPPEQEAANGE